MIKDIIDGHSHIAYENEFEIVGKNIMMPLISDIQKYNEIAFKNGIKTVLFSPCTSPIITNKIKNISTIYNLWKYENNKFIYFCEVIEKGKIIQKDMIKNPYYEVNKKLKKYLESLKTGLVTHYIPAINLYFDTPEYLEELISQKPLGLKIHGISTGLYDLNKINIELLNIISHSDIPLVIHTDYSSKSNTPIDILYQANEPAAQAHSHFNHPRYERYRGADRPHYSDRKWINILLKNNIRAYLTHGCRLDKESAKIINDNKNQFLVGIGPDILLNNEPERLTENSDNYLKDLFKIFNIDSLSFDIDYNWNYTDRISYTYDCEQLSRIKKIISDESDLKKVLKNNSKSFFKL